MSLLLLFKRRIFDTHDGRSDSDNIKKRKQNYEDTLKFLSTRIAQVSAIPPAAQDTGPIEYDAEGIQEPEPIAPNIRALLDAFRLQADAEFFNDLRRLQSALQNIAAAFEQFTLEQERQSMMDDELLLMAML